MNLRMIHDPRPQWITAAPATITDPRTLVHRDLIVRGLEESLATTTESGSLPGDIVAALSGLLGA